jgi:hypothetical protein
MQRNRIQPRGRSTQAHIEPILASQRPKDRSEVEHSAEIEKLRLDSMVSSPGPYGADEATDESTNDRGRQ